MRSCHRCRAPYEEPGQPGFNNTCPRCGMPLHACVNCRQFVSRGSVRCLNPVSEMVLDPGGGNRCQHFEFVSTNGDQPAEARQEAALGSGPTDPISARKRWEKLFGG